ncbi:methyl-accepting chemotaxis protein [Virgisporangium aliadipatigenens]|uniref:methyl-accepting chemotaxis protein n=1 Tax=Virgisporangium aliadipatigenens TaxID=741659 RepID=UPI0023B23E23|nr:methyl-accepting chemotaxis protein [Virgisporangium aliadipatigenens]
MTARTDERPASGVRPILAFCAVLAAIMWAHAFLGLGAEDSSLYSVWVFNGVLVGAAVACLRAAQVDPSQRWIAGVVGVGLVLDALGGLVATLVAVDGEVPVPSWADPLWLAIYPCEYVALLVLTRQRVGRTMLATRLDGMLSGLAVAAVVVCVTLPPAMSGNGGSPFWAKVTFLSYPIADLILLGGVVSAVALNGWRIDRKLAVLAAAVLAWEIGDLWYLLGTDETSKYGDPFILTGITLLATAVTHWTRVPERHVRADDRGMFVPVAFSVLPLGVLVLAQPFGLIWAGVAVAGLALIVALVRMAITMRENQRIIAANAGEIVARDRAQEELRATLAERDGLDAQMHDLLNRQRAAEEAARGRAESLLDGTNGLVTGPLHEVVERLHAVRSTATSIEHQVAAADRVTALVVDQAQRADTVVLALGESLRRVSGVAALINRVADQTNLLALNATIEAARAGENGRGFGVVANEVKDLSRDTARFTEEITEIIGELQTDAGAVASAIKGMSDGIGGIGTATTLIREEVDQQRTALEQLNAQADSAIAQAKRLGGEI